MEEITPVLEKEKEFRATISKLNYYIVGLNAAGLYILLQRAELLKQYSFTWFLYLLWTVGGVAFLCGVAWLYILHKYIAWELHYHYHHYRLQHRELDGELDPTKLVGQRTASLQRCQKAESKMRKLWPSGWREAFGVTLLWNVYQWLSGAFIVLLIVLGWIYIIKV